MLLNYVGSLSDIYQNKTSSTLIGPHVCVSFVIYLRTYALEINWNLLMDWLI